MKNRVRSFLAVPLVALVAAACSGNADVQSTAQPNVGVVTVRVENNLTPGTTVTAEAVDLDTRQREIFGSVSPLETSAFTYDPDGLRTGEYRLIATATDGTEYRSLPFTLVDARIVEWDMATNQVSTSTIP